MIIWRMRIASFIPKATNTHSKYVILFFHCHNVRTNAPQFYVIRIEPALLKVTAALVKGKAVNVQATKAHRGSGGTDPLLFNLCTSWRRAVSFKCQPPYSRGNTTRCTLNRRLGGLHSRFGELKREKFLALVETESQIALSQRSCRTGSDDTATGSV